ncbi:MAG: FmdB family transcriptional regulator [Ignavibacteriales bacterium CG07_land_8_20_14_0_80_59_12]|jgi:putative FmdB family regulatory protein|nr:MAG: FmdB family transcriptional regulator [Ignavibacteriales bacterium CG07_land_8_20_14_0_80_59_12]
MPTYQYKCRSCGHEYEELQPITAEPLKKCPHCGKYSLKRVISGAGLIFKGSGFYQTDYKKSRASTASERTATKAEKKEPSKNSKAGSSGSS